MTDFLLHLIVAFQCTAYPLTSEKISKNSLISRQHVNSLGRAQWGRVDNVTVKYILFNTQNEEHNAGKTHNESLHKIYVKSFQTAKEKDNHHVVYALRTFPLLKIVSEGIKSLVAISQKLNPGTNSKKNTAIPSTTSTTESDSEPSYWDTIWGTDNINKSEDNFEENPEETPAETKGRFGETRIRNFWDLSPWSLIAKDPKDRSGFEFGI